MSKGEKFLLRLIILVLFLIPLYFAFFEDGSPFEVQVWRACRDRQHRVVGIYLSLSSHVGFIAGGPFNCDKNMGLTEEKHI